MPRQPYARFAPHAHYSINFDSLESRPGLAAIIARCVSTWSHIELQLSLTLAALLDTTSKAAVAVYLSLQNARARQDALVSAAEVALSGEDKHVFAAVMASYKSLAGERNDLVHGVFGTLTERDDCLIWLPSSKYASFITRANHRAWNLEFDPDPHAPLRKELFVYRKNDLIEFHGQLKELWRATSDLEIYLAPIPNLQKRPILVGLCALPQIRAALDRAGHRDLPSKPS